MSVATRAAVLIVAFLCVVGAGVFAAVYYIGSATTQLPTVHYAASGGQVNVVLQEDAQNDSTTRPDWVTYYTQDPTTKQCHEHEPYTLGSRLDVRCLCGNLIHPISGAWCPLCGAKVIEVRIAGSE